MSDTSERFLDLAIKPLEGNPELHVHARWEISSKLKPGADGELGKASRILEERDRSGWRTMTARWIGWAVVLTILLYGGIQVHQLNESRQILGLLINQLDHIGDWTPTIASYVEHSSESRNSLDRLLLETDQTKATDAAKRLWDQEPANAALFANYAAFHFQKHRELPPDFLETAERLDPDNGWFLVLAAAAFADGSVKGESSQFGKGPLMAQRWTVLNAEELERASDCLHQASQLPRFESYQEMLLKRRRSLLPPDTDACTTLMNSACCETAAPSTTGIPLQLAHAIAAKAQILATAGDTAGFKRLLADWIAVSKTIIAQPDSGVLSRLLQKVLIAEPVRNLKEAAEKLGLADEARRLNEVDALIESYRKERGSRDHSARDRLIEDHGSVFGQLSPTTLGLTVKRPPILNHEDLMPSLRVDHSLFSSAVAVLLSAMFLVIAVATRIYRFRHGKLCCELAGRMSGLFTSQDWSVVIACGLILPSVYFAAIRYFTPLGRLGWSLKMPYLLIPAGQYALLFCLILATSTLILHHRFSKQTAFLDTPRLRQRLGISITILGFVALPVWGLSKEATWQEPAFIAGVGGLGMLLLWLLGLAIRALFGRADLALGRQTIGRLLVPILIAAAALFLAIIPLHHVEERYWMRQDKIVGLNPEHPDTSEYETAVKNLMCTELFDFLAPLDKTTP